MLNFDDPIADVIARDDDYMSPQEHEEFEREMEEMRKAAEVAERGENGM